MNIIDRKFKHILYLYHKRLLYQNQLQKYIKDKRFSLYRREVEQQTLYAQFSFSYYTEQLMLDINSIQKKDIIYAFEIEEQIKQEIKKLKKADLYLKRNQIHIEELRRLLSDWYLEKAKLSESLYQTYTPCEDDIQPFCQIIGCYRDQVQKRLGELHSSHINKESK